MRSNVVKIILIVVLVAVIGGGGYYWWQNQQRAKDQVALVKAANESFNEDPRYISFGSNYTFAVPKSYTVDENSLGGVQLLLPGGTSNMKVENFDQLFDAAVVAIQALPSEVEANNNQSLKKYVDNTVVTDLKKNVTEDVTVEYSYRGQYRAAKVIARKDGKQVRELFIAGGARPFMIAAKERSDAFNQAEATLLPIEDAVSAGDLEPIKAVIQSSMTLLQAEKVQELYDSGAQSFKEKTTARELSNAVVDARTFIKRSIVIPGGSIKGDEFSGVIWFQSQTQDEEPGIGAIVLTKVNGEWKLNGFTLPSDN